MTTSCFKSQHMNKLTVIPLILAEKNSCLAMARVNMMKNIVSDRRQPHSPLDNVNTPYNPIR